MEAIQTYPKMNETIKDLLRRSEEPMQHYILTRIEELEQQLAEEKKAAKVRWTSAAQRKPDAERRELIRNSPPGAYLYPCLVTRRSEQVEGRIYVAKHYYDGEEFLNNGEEVCTEFIIAWAPLPEPAEEGQDD